MGGARHPPMMIMLHVPLSNAGQESHRADGASNEMLKVASGTVVGRSLEQNSHVSQAAVQLTDATRVHPRVLRMRVHAMHM